MKSKIVTKEDDSAILTRMFDDLRSLGVKPITYKGFLNVYKPRDTVPKGILGGLIISDMGDSECRVTVFNMAGHSYSLVQIFGGGWGFYGYVTQAIYDYDVTPYMIDRKETIGI